MELWQIPGSWEGVILALGTYRLTRLGGWDDWPPIVKVRARLLGERWVPDDGAEMPGKTPESEVAELRPAYDRPTLAHLFHCPFCLGWWVALAVYIAWLAAPRETLYGITPFALAGAASLIAKNLDP